VTSGPAFRFRLERVRAVRERKEKLAKQELARAISMRADSEAELRGAERELERAQLELRRLAADSSPTSAGELLARQTFLERVEARRGRHAGELSRREAEVADRDAELTTAAGEHEMLNRLRERHRGEHDREAARHERNVLDEIASARFGRGAA
jgi:flagellar protein FliJ